MSIDKLIRLVPAWKKSTQLEYEPLNGGYSNQIYKVTADGGTFAFRINGSQNEHLGMDYQDEVEIMTLAAEYGITPEILDCGKQTDFLITRFLEGETLSTDQMKNPDIIKQVVHVMKKVHSLPYKGKRTSTPFSLTRSYLSGAGELGSAWQIRLADHLSKVDSIEQDRKKDPGFLQHYCHNDMLQHNIMNCHDGNLMLLDWELSGLGDIWFDIATVTFSSGLSSEEEDVLLTAYFGESNTRLRDKLEDMKYVCMIREIGWAVLHTDLNRRLPVPGNDFIDFAEHVLNRLENGMYSLI